VLIDSCITLLRMITDDDSCTRSAAVTPTRQNGPSPVAAAAPVNVITLFATSRTESLSRLSPLFLLKARYITVDTAFVWV